MRCVSRSLVLPLLVALIVFGSGSIRADELPKSLVKPGFNAGCRQRNTPESLQDLGQYWKEVSPLLNQRIQFLDATKLKPLIKIVVFKNGDIHDVSVLRGSESSQLDEKAVSALKAMSPLPPLPSNFPFNMDSHVLTYSNSDAANAPDTPKADPTEPKVDFGPFIRKLQQRVKTGWDQHMKPNYINRSLSTAVVFTLDMHTGKIFNPKIKVSSCDLEYDATTLRILHQASPIPKRYFKGTENFKGDTVDVEFVFDLDVKTLPYSR